MSRRIAIIVVLGFALIGGAAFAYRGAIREMLAERAKPELPPAVPYQPQPELPQEEPAEEPAPIEEPAASDAPEPEPAPDPAPTPAPRPAPSAGQANLAVPFTPQAPHADWSMPYQEACEEASLMMVHAYLANAGAFTPDEADRQIKALVAWQTERFGYYEDTDAEETAAIAREYYGYAASHAVAIASMEEVKREIDKGNAVILPAAGKLLKNPYFSGDGPRYHMLVAKGYTKDGKIITHDPGTRRGADFLYDEATLWNAIHDWNGGDVESGAKMMVVVRK